MYFFMMDSGAPPTVDTKYEFVQVVGVLRLIDGNSWRSIRDVLPFSILMNFPTPYCGSTDARMWMWSGMISSSAISEPVSRAKS